jgi:hypothetical protein
MPDITYNMVHNYLLFNASENELRSAVEAIKLRRSDLARAVSYTVTPGKRVAFTGKRGIKIEGVVKKINHKTLIVSTDIGEYKVPSSMISFV